MVHLYRDLPDRVMGLRCSQYRSFKMIQVLDHYKKQCRKKATKVRMLKLMVALEVEITDAEKKHIGTWMLSDNNIFQAAVPQNNKSRQSQGCDSSGSEEEHDHGMLLAPLNRNIAHRKSAPLSKVECSVCMEFFITQDITQTTTTIPCRHEGTVCVTCARKNVLVQISDRPYGQIACPECPELLTFDMVRNLSSPEDFDRYTMKGFKESLQNMDGYVKCLGPNCESGQIHGSGHDQPIMTCPECQFKTCFTHMMPWHTDKTCAEYDEEQRVRIEQERASKKVIAKTCRICPNHRCGSPIEKNKGCDHMTCLKCKHEFCWLCMVSYKEIRRLGNSAHVDTCAHHTNRLPSYLHQQ